MPSVYHGRPANKAKAYRRLLVRDGGGLKACLKRIPDEQKAGELCAVIAEKYVHLGLYSQMGEKWVWRIIIRTIFRRRIAGAVCTKRALSRRQSAA